MSREPIEWLKESRGRRTVKVTQSRIVALVQADDMLGLCCSCGADAYNVEGDARGYECEECGQPAVYGAEELLFSLGIGT